MDASNRSSIRVDWRSFAVESIRSAAASIMSFKSDSARISIHSRLTRLDFVAVVEQLRLQLSGIPNPRLDYFGGRVRILLD
jgi:hypothetical protein